MAYCVAVHKPDAICEEGFRLRSKPCTHPVLHHWQILIHARLLLIVQTSGKPVQLILEYMRDVGEVRMSAA